jgi:hypothetical protein
MADKEEKELTNKSKFKFFRSIKRTHSVAAHLAEMKNPQVKEEKPIKVKKEPKSPKAPSTPKKVRSESEKKSNKGTVTPMKRKASAPPVKKNISPNLTTLPQDILAKYSAF